MSLLKDDPLPKGMTPPAPQEAPEPPAPLTLADGNYAGAIRLALAALPVEVRVDRCIVVERAGRPPMVSLRLTILGEKRVDGHERNGAAPQPAEPGVRGEGP